MVLTRSGLAPAALVLRGAPFRQLSAKVVQVAPVSFSYSNSHNTTTHGEHMDQNMAIAELRARQDATDDAIQKLDERVTRHDEIIGSLREAVAKVATKDDVTALRDDINKTHSKQMADAINAIPGKWAAVFAGILALAEIIKLFVHHG